MNKVDINTLNWDKSDGLIPAIVQDTQTVVVLMLGYMKRQSLTQTLETQRVTFYSRSRKSLWTKGETSGNTLDLVDISTDCDSDALLVLAKPTGPTCHTGQTSCFTTSVSMQWNVLSQLTDVIRQRDVERPKDSYTTELFTNGISRIAQKVGEEGVEVVIAAMESNKEALASEAADLIFHLLVLLRAKEMSLNDVVDVLQRRFVSR